MVIALDIGGTKIAAALVDGVNIVERRHVPSVIHHDLDALVPTVIALCEPWVHKAKAIGIACTGLVSDNEVHFLSVGVGKVVPLKKELYEALGLPVVVLNDAWAAAWGEYILGAHAQSNTLVYITVSTGIGGGIVQQGQLVTNADGFAAHLGHLTVTLENGKRFSCSCGRYNCVESIASGTAIAAQASQLLGRDIECTEVFSLAATHRELDQIIQQAAEAVAQLIANVRAVTGTKLVVLGGSVGLADRFRQRVDIQLKQLADIYHVYLVPAALGGDADTLGAAVFVGNVAGRV